MSRPASASAWWRHAVIYQIYVRSFQDSNGDGIGDLPGVTQRLPYLQDLGVQAIWLTPFYPSPNADFGYDVADYTDVAPEYGRLADWDVLVAEAGRRGIRVLVDFVLNHSSDRHPWFQAARSSREHPMRDWYVWRDGRPDGSPPTNWKSIFGGPAWTFDPPSGQWYYHQFLPQQPDLNWRHPALREAMWDVARFWLRRGAAGFRLDATSHLFEDPAWPQDPAPELRPAHLPGPWAAGRPENHEVIRELRRVVDAFPGEPVLLGESTTDQLPELVAAYGAHDDEMQLPMNFLFARHWQRDAAAFKRLVDDAQAAIAHRTPVSFFSSHDHPRQASSFGDGVHDDAIARLTSLLVLAQRGTALMYYGEEIGMANLPADELAAAPVGPQRPQPDARDVSRTPMQWDATPQGGFTTGTPWLPLPARRTGVDVQAQQRDPRSLWHWYRRLIALKRDDEVFRDGAHVPLDAGHATLLAFGRRLPDGRGAAVVLNFGDQPRAAALAGWPGGDTSPAEAVLAHPADATWPVLPPYGCIVVRMAAPGTGAGARSG